MQRRQGIIQIAENRGRADLDTRDSEVDSASTRSWSLDVEVGLPRVQGHPVTDPQTESNGSEVEAASRLSLRDVNPSRANYIYVFSKNILI